MIQKSTRGIALPHLRAWRNRKGLSQRELAEKSGVQYSQISRIETQGQHVMPTTIRRLAAALDITREELIVVDPETKTPDSNASAIRQSSRRAVSHDTPPAESA